MEAGTTDLGSEVSRIFSAELLLLRATARYLLCGEIEEQVEKMLLERDAELYRWKEELEVEKEKLREERERLNLDRDMLYDLLNVPKTMVQCQIYHWKPGSCNSCDAKILLIGAAIMKGDELRCAECDKDPERRKQSPHFRARRLPDDSGADLAKTVHRCYNYSWSDIDDD